MVSLMVIRKSLYIKNIIPSVREEKEVENLLLQFRYRICY